MAKTKLITANLYSFQNKIQSGNLSLNNKIRIVLSYLINKHLELFEKIDESSESIDPYIPLSKNLLIKLCGMKSNYIKVVNYLNEHGIIQWYVSEHTKSKRGFSYYNGYSRHDYNGPNPKENYCKKCRFTEIFWNAVKSGNFTVIEVPVPISLLDSKVTAKDEIVKKDFQKVDWNEINEYREKVEKVNRQMIAIQIECENALMNESETPQKTVVESCEGEDTTNISDPVKIEKKIIYKGLEITVENYKIVLSQIENTLKVFREKISKETDNFEKNEMIDKQRVVLSLRDKIKKTF
jgi:hypothetical protein